MKKFALAGVAAAALIAIPVTAQVASGPRGPAAGPLTRAAVQSTVQTRFAKVDANHDGFVTRAEADARATQAREQMQERRAERRAGLFDRLDTDKNGAISRTEFDAHAAARAERRAARGGGGGGEMRGRRFMRHAGKMGGHGRGGMGGGFGAAMFDRLDADKDGRVSLAESTARALAMFDRADANRDGTVTVEERREARERFRDARQGRRGG